MDARPHTTVSPKESGMAATVRFEGGFPVAESAAGVQDEQDMRRAIEAYRFFYPTVSTEGIFRGTRAAGAVDNESVLLCLARPHHVGFTLNSDTPYAAGVLDLRASGPLVVELPPGPLIGLVDDHHQRWVADMGLPGPDRGKGGRHLILPPDHDGPVPDGYFATQCDTWTALLALRVLPIGADVPKANALVSSVKVYPLSKQADPAAFAFLDITGSAADTTCLAWEDNLEFWRVLHEVVDAEPAVPELRAMLGALAELGIEAGRPFAPDQRMSTLLTEAARRGRDEMLVSAFASRRPDRMVWPDRTWEWVGLRPENGSFERVGSLDVEAKDRWFAQAIVASPAMFRRAVGQGSLYWLGHRDQGGAYLDGSRNYRLTVPLPVPASLFWSVTCYDAQTRSEVQAEQGQAALRSLFDDLAAEGADSTSVDLYFGPEEPEDAKGRWIQTVPGRGWFAYFRIYGPQEPAFDGTWKPGDFTALDH